MFHEIRHYDTEDERGLRWVTQRFADHVLPAFARAGIAPVGFWTHLIGARAPRLTYLLPWESLGQRQERWDAFESDPLWIAARRSTNESYGGSPIGRIANAILTSLPGFSIPTADNQPQRLAGGIFELHQLQCRDYDALAHGIGWMRDRFCPLLAARGIHLMGCWSTAIGESPTLTYMLVFENLADREHSWAALHTDPRWPEIEAAAAQHGRSFSIADNSALMRGTEFSGWR